MPLDLTIARGGTSRAVFVSLIDVPSPTDQLCLQLIGSPDPIAVDGLGGGVSSNSKVMFVGPSTEPGVDIETLFAQVSPDQPEVDWSGNCGNITSAVSAYALDAGLITASGTSAVITIRNRNTGALIELAHPLEHGQLPIRGDFSLDGVAGTGPRVDVRFMRPGGEKTGQIFPCGKIRRFDTTRGGRPVTIDATLIDVANPIVIIRDHPEYTFAELMALREKAGAAMGVAASAAIPRVALVGTAAGNEITVRMTTVGNWHHSLPATGILALGAAAALGGTVIDTPPQEEAVLHHPKGRVVVTAQTDGDELEWVALARTARIIMRGQALVD